MKRKPLVIGIAGGTGSGKTTIANRIKEHFHNRAVFIAHDSYYIDLSSLSLEERGKVNFDHPNSLETNLLVRHIKELMTGKAVEIPIYDFTTHNRTEKTIHVAPKPIIIIEGILIFENEKLRNLFDIKFFVETDADIRLGRRITRDINQRGRTLEFSLHQYLTMSRPMHQIFVEPTKKYADIIIPEGGNNKVAISILIHAIERLRKSNRI
jgi:uridine kinase